MAISPHSRQLIWPSWMEDNCICLQYSVSKCHSNTIGHVVSLEIWPCEQFVSYATRVRYEITSEWLRMSNGIAQMQISFLCGIRYVRRAWDVRWRCVRDTTFLRRCMLEIVALRRLWSLSWWSGVNVTTGGAPTGWLVIVCIIEAGSHPWASINEGGAPVFHTKYN